MIPDPAEIDAVLAAGDGAIRMVTLAPELPGQRRGRSGAFSTRVLLSPWDIPTRHTSRSDTRVDLGATVGTHLFNAMPPLDHREPGPALALLEDPRVTVELIADGVHVHPAVVRAVIEAAGPDRVAVVTDAIAAAGCDDGAFRLGTVADRRRVRRGAGARNVDDRRQHRHHGSVLPHSRRARASDAALAAAVQMTSATPARALGLDGVGTLRPGYDANLVVLDRDFRVTAVMVHGDLQVTPCATRVRWVIAVAHGLDVAPS